MVLKKNIIIVMGLDNNKALTYVLPILKTNKINQLYIVRDSPLPYNDKRIKYFSPPKSVRKNAIIKTIYKFLIILSLSTKYDIDLIYGIHMFPHGILAWIFSKIFKQKFVMGLIAGDQELTYAGPLIALIVKKILLNADYLMITGFNHYFESKEQLPIFLKALNIEYHKLLPGYSSIFPEKFFPIKRKKKWDIITVGRLEPIKRLDLFIEIINRVRTHMEIKCAIIGDGSYKKQLQKIIRQKGLINNIDLLGWISNENLNEYYNQAKIFLLTSENEGLPATLIESMLTKACPISTNVGAISNLIKNGHNGFLYSLKNIQYAESMIIKCLKDDDFRKTLVKNSRKDALKQSAWNRTATWNYIFENLY